MLRNHSCWRCGNKYVTANPTSVCCDHCLHTQLAEIDLKSPQAELKTPDNTERDELAKEIFKLLTVDLTKAAMENPTAADNFRRIMENNCRVAFLHADIYMEQKSKCLNKSQSN